MERFSGSKKSDIMMARRSMRRKEGELMKNFRRDNTVFFSPWKDMREEAI
jgi:hypothetical protein